MHSKSNPGGIKVGYDQDGGNSIPDKNNRFLSSPQLQDRSGTHPYFYLMATGAVSPRREADHSSLNSTEVKNGVAIHLSHMS
jgi:hypothetical protein